MTVAIHGELNSTHGFKHCSIADPGEANIGGGGLYHVWVLVKLMYHWILSVNFSFKPVYLGPFDIFS